MEDPAKILAKINELNAATGLTWAHIIGYHALTKVEWSTGGANTVFNPSSGIPLKVFVCHQTGEIKTYHASFFET